MLLRIQKQGLDVIPKVLIVCVSVSSLPKFVILLTYNIITINLY